MGCKVKPTTLLVVCVFLLVSCCKHGVNGESQVPCYFIFGDSLSDNGNNNNLQTKAKCNYRPYGIDFPDGATGRFSNGRNFIDILTELLGFNTSIKPFTTASGQDLLRGVNYASGAAGIRDESGRTQGDRISMNTQLVNHKITIQRITRLLRSRRAAETYLKKCLYTVAIGNNDYLNNYFMPRFYRTSHQYNTQEYAQVLAHQFSFQLQSLYRDGARKIAVFGAGVIGCTPYALRNYDTNGSACVDAINNAVVLFNNELLSLVTNLNNRLSNNGSNATFTYIDPFSIALTSTSPPGFVTNEPCCEVERDELQCTPNVEPCANRSNYAFWDGVHPTATSNLAVSSRAYQAQLVTDARPWDIRRLVSL